MASQKSPRLQTCCLQCSGRNGGVSVDESSQWDSLEWNVEKLQCFMLSAMYSASCLAERSWYTLPVGSSATGGSANVRMTQMLCRPGKTPLLSRVHTSLPAASKLRGALASFCREQKAHNSSARPAMFSKSSQMFSSHVNLLTKFFLLPGIMEVNL